MEKIVGKLKPRKINNSKVKNAVSLEMHGLKFKSKLELFTYNHLVEAGFKDFKYEQVKFQLMEPFTYNNESVELRKDKTFDLMTPNIRGITYLPDFTCINEDKTGWIIEVKGYANDGFANKWKYFKEYLVKNGYNLTLYKPNNQQNVLTTINLIKQKYYE
jgi:hypothetical protein